ncbi:CENPA [Enterospora canceri]|uniref:CENPA n=1 Tax=Enterospora canceri TaxID=1081671 RepID=A0A1Y1S6U2_9MICR|nr:CENPA [Enterospora canceri]
MVRAKKLSRKSNTSETVSVKQPGNKKKGIKNVGTYNSNTPSKTISGSGKTKFKPFTKPKISQGKVEVKKKSKQSKQIFKEIKYYQNNIGFLVTHASMVRLVRELTNQDVNLPYKFTRTAFEVIQEATENHIVKILEYANLVARHAKRVTLYASDIQLVLRIKSGL